MGGDKAAGPAERQRRTQVTRLPDSVTEIGESMGEVCVVGSLERGECPRRVTVAQGARLPAPRTRLETGTARDHAPQAVPLVHDELDHTARAI